MRRLILAGATALALALTGLGVAPAQAATATTAKVTVTVTAPGGAPVAGAYVSVSGADYAYGETGSDGRFTTTELEPGSLTVRADVYSGAGNVTGSRTITLAANADQNVTIALSGIQVLRGKVTAGGKALAGKDVWIQAVSGGSDAWTATAPDGTYSAIVAPGSYRVGVNGYQETRFVTTYSGSTVREVDAKIVQVTAAKGAVVDIAAYAKLGTVKGKVVDTKGKAVAGATVSLVASNRAGYGQAVSAKDGTYTLAGLPAGTYTAQAWKEGFSPRSVTKSYTVRAAATTTVNPTVGKQAVHKGRIVLKVKASSKVWKRGSICATALTSKGLQVGGGCTDKKSKKITIPHLPAGTYKVTLNGTNSVQSVKVKKNRTTTRTVTRAVGTTVSGTARTASGKVLKKAYVRVADANGTLLGNVTTSSKGRYSVPGAIKGAYTVTASGTKASDGAWASAKVTVRKGRKATANVRLVKGAKITGKVTTSGGAGINGVSVTVLGANDYGFATTNAKGEFSIAGLRAGTYTVTTRDPYVGGYYDGKAVKAKVAKGKTKKAGTIRLATG